ncbi:MAG: tRNA (adenosine(37)-N6)-threonylcarbamoyltransferase complex dimerization subunit type 1 TsaB [Bacillota bacterium]|nr:tRNA (adenosine(37)-N6)-threonylcarbamoyltransferase complex dimerization subunit type 1 TsaB [Bacillota bacterium]
MVELAFDASARSASVCVIRDGQVLSSLSIENGNTHSEELMPLMDRLFVSQGLGIADVERIYVANGPGSFTGVRIALSIAKGLAHALNVPIVPVSTLDALSYHGKGHQALICPIMDARRARVYTAIYQGFGGERLLEASALSFEELRERLQAYAQPVLFVGDGIGKYREEISAITEFPVLQAEDAYQLANAEGVYAAAKAYRYEALGYAEALPVYLRKAQAEREKDAKRLCNSKTC